MCTVLAHFTNRVFPAENVYVQVENALTCILALVHHKAITLFASVLRGDFGNFYEHVFNELRTVSVHFGEKFEVVFGHGEKMHLRLRLDIFEHEHFIVFIHLCRGNLAPYYFTEKAIVFKHKILLFV